ncbi:MAG TPA: alcohol dehydrogenase catalytic domain-containing protein [Firmicutes bacterium]|nr:alcohol dehydrogenase catalytic domain-containing protein [Bacillota bacterium]
MNEVRNMRSDRMVKAAVLVEPGRLEIREYPYPTLEPGAAILKVEMCGICGTDKHTFKGEIQQYGGSEISRKIPFPIVLGHEVVGIIAELPKDGEPIRDYYGEVLKEGDRVVLGANIVCGKCYYCRHGFPYYLCENMEDYGNSLGASRPPHLFGGWAEYMYILPGSNLYKVPEGLPPRIAVLTELATLTNSLDVAKQFSTVANEGFRFGDTVVVQGAGPAGLVHIVKARMLGAGDIIAIDVAQERLEAAKEFGADYVLNAKTTTVQERIDAVKGWTRGRGADVVIECVGIPQVIPEGLEMLRPGGMYIEPGNFVDMGEVPINPHRHICTKNVRIIGVGGDHAASYGPIMKLFLRYKSILPLEKLVSHIYPLDQVEQAVKKSMEPDSRKVVIAP